VRGRRLLCVALAALALAAAGCSGEDAPSAAGGATPACGRPAPPPADPPRFDAPPPMTIDPAATYTATIDTSCGPIVARLDPRLAPVAVNSFVFLAREGFFDGLTFHRAVPGYVIQGGDPEGTGSGGPGYTFDTEPPPDGYPPGALAMANAGPGTNGSQFFIVTGDASFLPNDYTRFGRVVEGLDVARRLESYADTSIPPGDPRSGATTAPLHIHSVRIDEGAG
jgi:cyclophilin family peptidyl-prolyl cis-trans isomerase